MAEWSKKKVFGARLSGGVGSNPTAVSTNLPSYFLVKVLYHNL